MHAYCTQVLHLSEAAAYLRIAVARAAREYPVLLEWLSDGRLHLSGITKLASYLTDANCDVLLKRAEHCSKDQIDELIAEITPRADVATTVRKLPARRRTSPLRPELAPSGPQLCPGRVAPTNPEVRDAAQSVNARR